MILQISNDINITNLLNFRSWICNINLIDTKAKCSFHSLILFFSLALMNCFKMWYVNRSHASLASWVFLLLLLLAGHIFTHINMTRNVLCKSNWILWVWEIERVNIASCSHSTSPVDTSNDFAGIEDFF